MSVRTLRWTRRAIRRTDQIASYIAKDDPKAAVRVMARIASAANNLITHPAMGRIGRIKDTREYVLADIPYIIVYKVKFETIEIVTIFHGAQQLPLKLH